MLIKGENRIFIQVITFYFFCSFKFTCQQVPALYFSVFSKSKVLLLDTIEAHVFFRISDSKEFVLISVEYWSYDYIRERIDETKPHYISSEFELSTCPDIYILEKKH